MHVHIYNSFSYSNFKSTYVAVISTYQNQEVQLYIHITAVSDSNVVKFCYMKNSIKKNKIKNFEHFDSIK